MVNKRLIGRDVTTAVSQDMQETVKLRCMTIKTTTETDRNVT